MKATSVIKTIFLLIVVLSSSLSLGLPVTYDSAYLYCPSWRNIGAKAVIVLNGQSYKVAIADDNSQKAQLADKLLSNYQFIACGIHTIGAISPKFKVKGEFQQFKGQYTFVVQEVVE